MSRPNFRRPLKSRRLSDRLEKAIEQRRFNPAGVESAELDSQVADHLQHFLATWNELPSVEGFSLETKEAAEEALTRFREINSLLEQRLRTVGALKRLLASSKT